MDLFQTRIRLDSPEFQKNRDRMTQLVAELARRTEVARQGGGEKYLQRHRSQGKLPVRERIDGLLDPGSPFLELSTLAAADMYEGDAPTAGLVTGIGRVSGREVVIVANDATVKGGTTWQITDKKLMRAELRATAHHQQCGHV